MSGQSTTTLLDRNHAPKVRAADHLEVIHPDVTACPDCQGTGIAEDVLLHHGTRRLADPVLLHRQLSPRPPGHPDRHHLAPASHHRASATEGRHLVTPALVTPAPGSDLGAGATAAAPAVSWADFRAWERQLASTGHCSHPIRLRGHIEAVDLATGELAPVDDTNSEPGGELHVACGNRRESVCPACSAGVQARRPPARPRRARQAARESPRRSPRTRACSPP